MAERLIDRRLVPEFKVRNCFEPLAGDLQLDVIFAEYYSDYQVSITVCILQLVLLTVLLNQA